MENGPAKCRASISITSAVGCLYGLDRFAGLHSASVAAHFSHVPYPWRDRPCRDVQQQTGVTLLHFREVQRLCCDRYLPCRLRRFSPQGAPTDRMRTRSGKSRNGVMGSAAIGRNLCPRPAARWSDFPGFSRSSRTHRPSPVLVQRGQ